MHSPIVAFTHHLHNCNYFHTYNHMKYLNLIFSHLPESCCLRKILNQCNKPSMNSSCYMHNPIKRLFCNCDRKSSYSSKSSRKMYLHAKRYLYKEYHYTKYSQYRHKSHFISSHNLQDPHFHMVKEQCIQDLGSQWCSICRRRSPIVLRLQF